MNNIKKSFKASNGITLIALVITIIVLLILAGISISMLAGDNSILSKSTDSKIATEKAEAKEQAKIDIMAWIADKTSNHEDAALDDSKIQEILTGKFYVKTANATSFITAKGEYEIPYSELYTATETIPTTSYGLSTDGTYFIGRRSTGKLLTSEIDNRQTNTPVYDGDGYKFTAGHFIYVENYTYSVFGNTTLELGEYTSDVYLCWDDDGLNITSAEQRKTTEGQFDIFDASTGEWLFYDGGVAPGGK